MKQVETSLSSFEDAYAAELETVSHDAELVAQECMTLERSWSGSYAGWHGKMYFQDFHAPSVRQRFSGEWGAYHGMPKGWFERSPEDIAAFIATNTGVNVKEFETKVDALRVALADLRDDVAPLLDARTIDLSPQDNQELTSLRAFSFGETKAERIQARLPRSLYSRDSEAVLQGVMLPAWLYYACLAAEGRDLARSFDDYKKRLKRLMRTIESRSFPPRAPENPKMADFHPTILAKCAPLYAPGTFAEAVEKSFKIVRDRLRELTGYETGSEAFGKGKLFINGAAAANVESDFNQAVKFLLMAIDMFRNEKSHSSDAHIGDPTRAHQYLALSSLALSLLENAEVRK